MNNSTMLYFPVCCVSFISESAVVILLVLTNCRLIASSYNCLCCYSDHVPVYEAASNTSRIIGALQMYDCNPTSDNKPIVPGFFAIQYHGKIGYVVHDGSTQHQLCTGQPPPTSPPSTTTTTFVSNTTTTTLQTTTTPLTTSPTLTSSRPITKSTTKSTTTNVRTTKAVSSTTESMDTIDCSSPWTKYGTSCYLFMVDVHDVRAWGEAQIFCGHRQSHLVFIESWEEQQFIQSYLSNPGMTRTDTWIGAKRNANHPWRWRASDGYRQIYSYHNWAPGERDGEGCALTSEPSNLWSAHDCTESHGFVCEKSPHLLCEPGWVSGRDSCYLFRTNNTDIVSWDTANTKCMEEDSHLVFIESDSEQTFLEHHLQHDKNPDSGHGEHFLWGGATDKTMEGTWVWNDDRNQVYTPLGHLETFWRHGHDVHNRREDCAAVSSTDPFKWKSFTCSTNFPYICEKHPSKVASPLEPIAALIG